MMKEDMEITSERTEEWELKEKEEKERNRVKKSIRKLA